MNTNIQIPTPQDESMRVAPVTTITVSGYSASLDHGAGYNPAMGIALVGVLNITALVGTGTYTVQMVESDDNATWFICGGPVTVNTAKVWGCRGVSTKRYTALAWTIGGTSPSLTYEAWLNSNVGR